MITAAAIIVAALALYCCRRRQGAADPFLFLWRRFRIATLPGDLALALVIIVIAAIVYLFGSPTR